MAIFNSYVSHNQRVYIVIVIGLVGQSSYAIAVPGYEMNRAVILPKGPKSDPRGHWRSLKRRHLKERCLLSYIVYDLGRG